MFSKHSAKHVNYNILWHRSDEDDGSDDPDINCAPSFKPAVKVWAQRSACTEKRAPSYDPRYEVTDELRRVVDDE